jgi:hypothetical protein
MEALETGRPDQGQFALLQKSMGKLLGSVALQSVT